MKPRAWHSCGLKTQIHLFGCSGKNREPGEDLRPVSYFLIFRKSPLSAETFSFDVVSSGALLCLLLFAPDYFGALMAVLQVQTRNNGLVTQRLSKQ